MWGRAAARSWQVAACRRWRSLHSKVPPEPTWNLDPHTESRDSTVSLEVIEHLEHLALVDFRNQDGVQRLAKAIHFANQLHQVNIEGVEPLVSVLEDRALYIRADTVTAGGHTDELIRNSSKIIEEYFVAPPGNIPLPSQQERDLLASEGEEVKK